VTHLSFADWAAIQVGALLTLGIVSFLYKDNPFYKVCESVFVGLSAGYWFVVLFWENLVPKLYENLKLAFQHPTTATGSISIEWLYLIALIFGIMMLLRLVPKLGWLSRWPLAFVVGATAGLYFITYLQSNALSQLRATLVPIISFTDLHSATSPTSSLNAFFKTYLGNIVVLVGTVTGLFYFYFSKEHKGWFGNSARVGIYFLMITFGASFGYTVMSRMSLLIGRIDFLISDWWPALTRGWM
jgi:hypothetical protein